MKRLWVGAAMVLMLSGCVAGASTISFERFTDGTAASTQDEGASFRAVTRMGTSDVTAIHDAPSTGADAGSNSAATGLLTESFANLQSSVSGVGGIGRAFSASQGSLTTDEVQYAPTPESRELLLMGTGLFMGAGLCIVQSSRRKRELGVEV